jgi:diketogulonate reductase-like aldo/keto reductase
VQRGTVPLGKSSDPERIKRNLQIGKLTEEEMRSLDALDLGGEKGRIVAPDWSHYTG